MPDPAPLLDVADVAERLRVHPRFVYRAVAGGFIPHLRVGRFLRFRAEDVEAYLRAHSVEATR